LNKPMCSFVKHLSASRRQSLGIISNLLVSDDVLTW
jgi:hypothetical protein